MFVCWCCIWFVHLLIYLCLFPSDPAVNIQPVFIKWQQVCREVTNPWWQRGVPQASQERASGNLSHGGETPHPGYCGCLIFVRNWTQFYSGRDVKGNGFMCPEAFYKFDMSSLLSGWKDQPQPQWVHLLCSLCRSGSCWAGPLLHLHLRSGPDLLPTVEHILLFCSDFIAIETFYNSFYQILFQDTSLDVIFNFLKEINTLGRL